MDSVAAPITDDNPYGLALTTEATTIASEAQSARDFRWDTQRAWKIANPTRTNRHGTHTGVQAGARGPRSRRCWIRRHRSTSGLR